MFSLHVVVFSSTKTILKTHRHIVFRFYAECSQLYIDIHQLEPSILRYFCIDKWVLNGKKWEYNLLFLIDYYQRVKQPNPIPYSMLIQPYNVTILHCS